MRALLAALVIPLASCGTPEVSAVAEVPAGAGVEAARVELDVFSGRPNPTWTLTDVDDAALRQRLRALPAAAPATLHSDLGYRGLIVHLQEADASRVVRIQRGHVRTEGPAPAPDRADAGRALERWLLETGRGDLEPAVYEAAASDPPA